MNNALFTVYFLVLNGLFVLWIAHGQQEGQSAKRDDCLTEEKLHEHIEELETWGIVNQEKFCLGSASGPSGDPYIYLALYARYKNCEVVVGNLEVPSIDCSYKNYSFLNSITEVTGIGLCRLTFSFINWH